MLTEQEAREKLSEFDEELRNTPPAKEGEPSPEDLEEEIRQIEEAGN